MRKHYCTLFHDGSKNTELFRSIETDEIHTSITTKVTSVKPIPVFKFVPWFTPGQKVIMVFPFHV